MMGDLLMRHKPRPWPPLYRPSPEYPGLKGRDYYFFSPPWRGALAGPARGPSGRCGCARPRSLSRSMEDVRGAEVFEGPARRGPSLPLPPSARRSAENLLDQSFQVCSNIRSFANASCESPQIVCGLRCAINQII